MLERLLYQIEHEGLLGETPFMQYMQEKEEKMREEMYAKMREEMYAQALQEGVKIGEQKGRDQERQALALKMLSLGVGRAIILQVTGLSEKELAALATSSISSA